MLRTTVLRRIPSLHPQHRPDITSWILHQRAPCYRAIHQASTRTVPVSLLRLDAPQPTFPDSTRRVGHTVRAFHSTPSRRAAPLLVVLASVLKASASIEYARMAARIAFTFVPVVLLKNHAARKYMSKIIKDKPEMQDKKIDLQNKIRHRTILYRSLIFFPILLFGLTLVASLERAPLTGRWRLILLSPEEEDDIASQLAGTGWYNAVGEILSQDGPQTILPPADWRYQWVRDTLRQLESIIPILSVEKDADTPWLDRGPDDAPLPPPAEYPLKPRPNAKEVLRWFCEMTCARVAHPTPHTIPGPPYSLLIVDRPDCHNAFSFGFGPDGGGGIVVYSGFLDEILSAPPPSGAQPPAGPVQLKDTTRPDSGFWSSFLGSFFALSPPPSQTPCPTPEQTSQLAILLAHELAHLILSHHLETLSSGTVIIPGTLSMAADLFRALLFPVTMLFGPFVNDAVANLGKVGFGEVGKLQEYCTSMSQEFEADTVSARLLAHAGFDARSAVKFWEDRHERDTSECTPKAAQDKKVLRSNLPRRIMGSTHPVHEVRVQRLKQELNRWEVERQEQLKMTPSVAEISGSDIDGLAGHFE